MRVSFFVIILMCSHMILAQKFENLSLIEKAIELDRNEDRRASFIEVHQFLDVCIFDTKCGVFMNDSFKKFGLVKGVFISVDRRLRCNSLSRSQALPVRFNNQGFLIDHAEDYSFRTH